MTLGRLARLITLIAIAVVMMRTPAMAGDRIAELTTMLADTSDKARLSAAVSLARLADKRAMKPLVTALRDPNAQVRAVAATALGKLGHQAAYPALKAAATDDVDATVRTTAREAALAVAKTNNIKDEFTNPPPAPAQAQARTSGFGRSPRAVEEKPDLYVTVKSANDDSAGKVDKPARKVNADLVKAVLLEELRTAPLVTTAPATEAQRWRLDVRTIDVSIVKLDQTTANGQVEVATELRLAIAVERAGSSILSGGAKVQIPTTRYQPKYLINMKRDAITGAMRGMMDKLLVHLRKIANT